MSRYAHFQTALSTKLVYLLLRERNPGLLELIEDICRDLTDLRSRFTDYEVVTPEHACTPGYWEQLNPTQRAMVERWFALLAMHGDIPLRDSDPKGDPGRAFLVMPEPLKFA
jgi:hypothetical protein